METSIFFARVPRSQMVRAINGTDQIPIGAVLFSTIPNKKGRAVSCTAS
ncbi:hypothetical protein TR2A62_0663 [Thalassobium sp. R2A62]|nr:hypothetical protein TR2A62_0663 [Thalassobium sp. R2A62]